MKYALHITYMFIMLRLSLFTCFSYAADYVADELFIFYLFELALFSFIFIHLSLGHLFIICYLFTPFIYLIYDI